MLTVLIVILRSIGLICRGHRAVALENLALRQQVAALTRTVRRRQLRTRGLFWILLAQGVAGLAQGLARRAAETVVQWHRQWLRRRWTWRSTPTRPGRPARMRQFECQRIIHINFTEHPTAAWTAQQMVEALSWGANTSGLGEGRADATTRSDADGRACGRVPGSGRITSSLRTTRRVIGTSRC